MSVHDWHVHDQQVAPLVVVPPQSGRRDSRDAASGARLAGDLVALTRVLLGVGDPDAALAPVSAPTLAVVPDVAEQFDVTGLLEVLEPLDVEGTPASVANSQPTDDPTPLFVAPPVVEIAPLVAPQPALPPVEVAPVEETAAPTVAPRRASTTILDELAFLDL